MEARKAIGRALSVISKRGTPDPAGWLLASVQAFAKSRAGQDAQFTPYPATWFNAGSYDEDFTVPFQGQNGTSSRPKPIGSMSAQIAAHRQPAS